MANNESENQANSGGGVPPSAAVSFITTEHFTLQGARSSTIAEATGRASMFLGAVSGAAISWRDASIARSIGRSREWKGRPINHEDLAVPVFEDTSEATTRGFGRPFPDFR